MGKLTAMDKLLQYLNSLSKEARTAFCSACGTTEGYLRVAVSAGKQLGGTLCILIERESNGAVQCEDLAPGADWAFIRSGGATAKGARRRSRAASVK